MGYVTFSAFHLFLCMLSDHAMFSCDSLFISWKCVISAGHYNGWGSAVSGASGTPVYAL